MTFYTDKWILGSLDSKELILVRKSKRNLFLERISQTIKGNRTLLTKEILEEFDVSLSADTIYILYQNTNGHLILNVIKGDKIEEKCLTNTAISEIFNLCLEVKDKYIHILYTIKGKDEKCFINHHFYDGANWNDILVDEISVKKVINPMKAVFMDEKLLLVYYRDQYKISIKSFSVEEAKWTLPTSLVSGDNEKLFLDVLILDKNIHLCFCEYVYGNLVVKHYKFRGESDNYNLITEDYISNEGSPSHPSIIYFKNELWISWLELDKVFSRSSKDMGQSWGPIYMWNETKKMDFIRYKYITVNEDNNINLSYSFGSIYPEIRFLGFGPTDSAVEIPVKKNIIEFQRMRKRIEELEGRIKILEESLHSMEDYLVWRSRGNYRRTLKRPP